MGGQHGGYLVWRQRHDGVFSMKTIFGFSYIHAIIDAMSYTIICNVVRGLVGEPSTHKLQKYVRIRP